MLALLRRVRQAAERASLDACLVAVALGVALYVIVAPLAASRYVPMIDLPFHAAQGATFRHYWDPDYHLREQFTLHPLASPYMTTYALIAVLMLVFPALYAVKIAVAILLALVPGGLAVLFHGAKKSPLLGLLGLSLCWGSLSHWGFLNYVAALGLFAMVVGFTLRVVDHPTRGRQLALALALVVLFFTHIFRFPYAVAAVVGTAVVMYPATRRVRPVVLPLLPSLLLFAAWWKVRLPALDGKLELGLHPERLGKDLGAALVGGFTDHGVAIALIAAFLAGLVVAAVAAVHAWRLRRVRPSSAWDVGVTLVPLACALVFLMLFLVLPLWIGVWWYVYPREATAMMIILCGACPDLPRPPRLRVPLVALMAIPALAVGWQVESHYAEFAASSEDFYRITRRIPAAPRLFYMIADGSGTGRTTSPFMHLPAYVQAEKGGWLSWHFAIWDVAPVRYRPRDEPGAVVSPPLPHHWEWGTEPFELSMTPFFDWFLVRRETSPDALFAGDPEIVPVDHVGRWWLYRRASSVSGTTRPAGNAQR